MKTLLMTVVLVMLMSTGVYAKQCECVCVNNEWTEICRNVWDVPYLGSCWGWCF